MSSPRPGTSTGGGSLLAGDSRPAGNHSCDPCLPETECAEVQPRGSWGKPVFVPVPTQGSCLCWSLRTARAAWNWRWPGFPAGAGVHTWYLRTSCGGWSGTVPLRCAPRAGWRMAPWGESGMLRRALLPSHPRPPARAPAGARSPF